MEGQDRADILYRLSQLELTQKTLTVTGTNWTTTRAVGIAYKTINGVWRLTFNIVGTVSIPASSIVLTIANVVFKNISRYYQSGNAFCYGTGGGLCNCLPNTGVLGITSFSGNTSNFSCSGDMELNAEPTI